MKQMVAKLLRGFMGTLIANQLGQGIGLLANSITSANDVAIPLLRPDCGSHLIPQNIQEWSDGLGIEKSEVNLYLALREVAASRLFAKNTWLHTYLRDAITTYGKGITIDVESITRQAEEAMSSGEIDINNPQSINIALNSGLFTPQQSNSPMQQLFASLLGIEISPRKMREASAFWGEVKTLRGADGRDKCWEDPAFLPMPKDLADAKAFLDSVTVPDDLSGLI